MKTQLLCTFAHKSDLNIVSDYIQQSYTIPERRIFVFANGHQPMRIDGAFKRLMRDSGMGLSHDGQMRTLYSLRHTYATLELLENKTDIHTLSKQMGNSAAMIDRHYSKLTATMAADRLA